MSIYINPEQVLFFGNEIFSVNKVIVINQFKKPYFLVAYLLQK